MRPVASLTVSVGESSVLLAAGGRICGQAGDRAAEHLLVRRLQEQMRQASQTAGQRGKSHAFLLLFYLYYSFGQTAQPVGSSFPNRD